MIHKEALAVMICRGDPVMIHKCKEDLVMTQPEVVGMIMQLEVVLTLKGRWRLPTMCLMGMMPEVLGMMHLGALLTYKGRWWHHLTMRLMGLQRRQIAS